MSHQNEEFDVVHAILELNNEKCGLKHSEFDPVSNHPAVNFICQYLGERISENEDVAEVEVRIPICKDCADGLKDPEWLLFYCIKCQNSQWMIRKLARRPYPKDEQIIWMDSCPFCWKE